MINKITSLDQLDEHQRRCYELAEMELTTMPVGEMMNLALNIVFNIMCAKSEEEIKEQHDTFFAEPKLH